MLVGEAWENLRTKSHVTVLVAGYSCEQRSIYGSHTFSLQASCKEKARPEGGVKSFSSAAGMSFQLLGHDKRSTWIRWIHNYGDNKHPLWTDNKMVDYWRQRSKEGCFSQCYDARLYLIAVVSVCCFLDCPLLLFHSGFSQITNESQVEYLFFITSKDCCLATQG